MKAKKFNKKLLLNKKTVANLNNDKMSGVRGGMYTVQLTCGAFCDTDFTCEDLTVCGVCWTQRPTVCESNCSCQC